MQRTTLPFGLAVSGRSPIRTERLDYDAMVWDADRQIMLTEEGDQLIPLMRHTDGVTTTDSNTDGRGRETDTDHRED